MTEPISASVRRLLDGPNLAHVATVDRNGAPRVHPTWIACDGETLQINTREGRAWPRRIRRNGRVALSIVNADDASEYAEIVGSLVGETTMGAREHFDWLARVYTGADFPRPLEREMRVILQIQPEWIRYVAPAHERAGFPQQDSTNG